MRGAGPSDCAGGVARTFHTVAKSRAHCEREPILEQPMAIESAPQTLAQIWARLSLSGACVRAREQNRQIFRGIADPCFLGRVLWRVSVTIKRQRQLAAAHPAVLPQLGYFMRVEGCEISRLGGVGSDRPSGLATEL